MQISLNERTWQECEALISRAHELRIEVSTTPAGTLILDCGVRAVGGLGAGIALAEICMATLGRISIVPGSSNGRVAGPAVAVHTDAPVEACLASQYAGWRVSRGKYFAMASGPMRAAYGKEELYNHIAGREEAIHAVGVLETGELPDNDVCNDLAAACNVGPEALLLLVARTNSLAGCIQIVARSVETALHKLHELQFDVARIRSGFGVAPLPPLAADDMSAIGRTNDAILYGADVTLWVTGEDDSIAAVGPRTPSNGSRDFGRPFAQVFREYEYDFYKIDPLLFSPARITFVNVESGRMHVFGELRPDVLAASFTGK